MVTPIRDWSPELKFIQTMGIPDETHCIRTFWLASSGFIAIAIRSKKLILAAFQIEEAAALNLNLRPTPPLPLQPAYDPISRTKQRMNFHVPDTSRIELDLQLNLESTKASLCLSCLI